MKDAEKMERLKQLHEALMTIVSEMNRPQRDAGMVKRAGIALDRALFPLLVRIERQGPIRIGDLADSVGRNYTSVSRQVSKLEELGFVRSYSAGEDRRVRESVVTDKGRKLTQKIDSVRAGLGKTIFDQWNESDVEDLVRLMVKFAGDLKRHSPES